MEHTTRMKAIRIHSYGAAEQMQLEDAPVPVCGNGDLLVRVVAAGVNPIDWKIRAGAMDRHERDEAFSSICARTGAEPVQQVGKVFVIFRKKPVDQATD